MARKNDIAGLAALGALGMMLSGKGEKAPVEDRTGRSVSGDTRDYGVDYSEAPTRGRDFMTEAEPGWESGTAPARRPSSGGRTTPSRPSSSGYTGSGGSGGGRGPAFGEVEAYRQSQFEEAQKRANTPEGRAERQRMEESQALKAVHPEEYLIGGGSMAGVKTVAKLAKGLANRQAARGVEKAAEYSQPAIGYADRARLTYSGGENAAKGATKQLPGPTRQIGYDGAKKADRDIVTNPLEWASGRNSALLDKKNALSEADWTGGAVGYRKGGKTKKMASGGSVKMSSASRRGDGIAQRGKTRGVMR